MPSERLTHQLGIFAQDTEDLNRLFKEYPTYFPLVHPSPRNQMWMKKNPWFAADVLPDLKARVASLLA